MKAKKIVWIVFAVLLGAGIFWWTTVKNKVVKQAVTKAVQKKSDSLYRITYDTAVIDEVGGNAYIYNLHIALDSIEWLKLVQKDSMPPVTMDLHIDKISIKGLKELKLIGSRSLDVSSILLEKPVFRLERWARKNPPATPLNDTLEVYKRLIGQLDFLRAGNISIVNGDITLLNYVKKDSIKIKTVNISTSDILVDSLHNYHDVVSYFIGQTKASVSSFTSEAITTGHIDYDSKMKYIRIDGLATAGKKDTLLSARHITVTGFSPDHYIQKGEFRASKLAVDIPRINIPGKGNNKGNDKADASMPAVVKHAHVDTLLVQKGNISIRSGTGNTTIRDANLRLLSVDVPDGKFNPAIYLNPARLMFTIGSVNIPSGIHKMDLNNISYPGSSDILSIRNLDMKPVISRQDLKTKIRKQADMYTIHIKNIGLDRFDLAKLIHDTISIAAVSMQMNIHVFDDKTLVIDSVKKGRGRFPFENIRLSKMAIDIRTLYATRSTITYEEQAPKSGKNGSVFFTNVNGKVTNITNFQTSLARDNIMKIEASALLMDKAPLHSNWSIPLNETDGSFTITGKVGAFSIPILNQAFEPLAMASIRSGTAEKMEFVINGNHEGSTGTVLLNYNDLKIDLLRKNKEDSLEKKGVLSFLANADIRNNYHADKAKPYKFKKDRYKSMFNLLWHSIFEGAKETMYFVK